MELHVCVNTGHSVGRSAVWPLGSGSGTEAASCQCEPPMIVFPLYLPVAAGCQGQ